MSNKVPNLDAPVIDMKNYEKFNVVISQIPPMDLAFQQMALTDYELLVATIYKLNELIKVTNDYTMKISEVLQWILDDGLKSAVLAQLIIWLNDGTLEELINETLFKMKLDKTEFYEFLVEYEQQLVEQGITDKEQSDLISELMLIKLDKTTFEEFEVENSELISTKLDKTVFDDYKTIVDNLLAKKEDTTAVDLKIANLKAETKADLSEHELYANETFQHKSVIDVTNYGIKNNGENMATQFQTLLDRFYGSTPLSTKKYMTVAFYFPKGYYNLGNLFLGNYNGLTILGDGISTVITSTNETACLNLDSTHFAPRNFIENVRIENVTIENNGVARDGILLNNIVRSTFKNIDIINGHSGHTALTMHMAVSILFENIRHSTNMYNQQTLFQTGIAINYGTGIGASTNNTFLNTIIEGTQNGLIINDGDENTFIGGTFEACSQYGIIIRGSGDKIRCRFNTFMNVHMEANNVTEISDSGFGTKYINCFTGQSGVVISDNATFVNFDGGIHQLINIARNALGIRVERLKVGHYTPPGNILTNGNTSYKCINIIDGNNSILWNADGTHRS